MLKNAVIFVLVGLVASMAYADSKDCDNCNRLAEVGYLACFKKAKSEAEKTECDSSKDKQKKVCNITKCTKLPF